MTYTKFFFATLIFLFLLLFTACGASTTPTGASGFPSVSVKCGDKACVK